MRRSLVSGGGASVVLLLVLCCQTLSDAGQPGTETERDVTLLGTLDQLWMFVDGAVQKVIRAVVTGVASRLTEVQTQCVAQAGQLSDQLETVRTEMQAQNAQLKAQNAELAAQNSDLRLKLDDVRAELAAHNTRLSTQNGELAAQNGNLTRQLDEVRVELSGQLSVQSAELTGSLDRVRGELSALQAQLGQPSPPPPPPPRDCSELPATAESGVHLLQLGVDPSRPLVSAFCDRDMDGGSWGWTVFQRRTDVEPRQDFFLDWEAYKQGFGALDAEFWWGLEHLWLLTSQLDRSYELRIDMEDFEGEKRHAVYQGFRIASEEENYRLAAVDYKGNASDSFTEHNGHPFTTKDRDNDDYSGNCASLYSSAWWYTACHSSNLNGRYLSGQHGSYADGVNWAGWKGYHYSLKTVTMKIRPTKKCNGG